MKVDKEITKVRILLLIGFILCIVGFFICSIEPKYVFIGFLF